MGTGQTQDVWVGVPVQPKAVLLNPQGNTIVTPQWTVPGKILKDWQYDSDSTLEVPVLQADLQVLNPGWFWVDGGEGRDVVFTGSVAGQNFSVKTTYNVKRPDATVFNGLGTISVNTNGTVTQAQLGNTLSTPASPGIVFHYDSNTPNAPGNFYWVQVVGSSNVFRTDVSGVPQRRIVSGPVLDGTVPYSAVFADPRGTGGTVLIDSPGEPLDPGFSSYSRNDSFETYLLFQATGGFPVPISISTWSWGFSAESSDGGATWTLTSSTLPNPSHVDTTDYPEWTGNINPLPGWESDD
tara:strand:- start:1182 stop:2069 length:888 start_codon:yes stop_codon:yes gene_type:complete